jgi:tetrathionate reductase subunit A
VEPTNSVIVNSQDAARMGLKTGDMVRITSKTNPEGVWDLGNGETVPMDGQVQVLEGLRPAWWASTWATATGPTAPTT